MRQIHPANSVAPSFVYVNAVVLNLIFLSDPCVQHLNQFVVHVVRKIIGGKFIAHQSLTGNRKMQREVPSIPSPLKRSMARRSHNLETHDEAQVDNGASLPEQLYFHTLLIDEVTKNDTQAFLEVEVEADQRKKPLLCKVDTGAEGNVISLNSCKSLFPSSPCNPNGIPVNLASSSTTIVAFGGHPVDHYGICHLKLAHGSSCKSYLFHVVDADGPTILGLP